MSGARKFLVIATSLLMPVFLVQLGNANENFSEPLLYPQPEELPASLIALEKCPTHETACLEFDVNFLRTGEDLAAAQDQLGKIAVDIKTGEDFGIAFVHVPGSLNGAQKEIYRVAFPYPADMMNCRDFRVAIVGVSGDGGGIVLTDRGELKISGTDFSVGDRSSIIVIDKKTLTRKYHLAPSWERYAWGAELIVKPDERTVWLTRNKCLDLESGERFQILPDSECRGGGFSRPTQKDIDRIRGAQLFEDRHQNESLTNNLWQPPGAPFLVYIHSVACT